MAGKGNRERTRGKWKWGMGVRMILSGERAMGNGKETWRRVMENEKV